MPHIQIFNPNATRVFNKFNVQCSYSKRKLDNQSINSFISGASPYQR